MMDNTQGTMRHWLAAHAHYSRFASWAGRFYEVLEIKRCLSFKIGRL